jgi:hypothetical protein
MQKLGFRTLGHASRPAKEHGNVVSILIYILVILS